MTLATVMNHEDVAKFLKVSVRTVKRMRADGLMPQPFRVGRRALRWSFDEIEEWFQHGTPEESQWTPIWQASLRKRKR